MDTRRFRAEAEKALARCDDRQATAAALSSALVDYRTALDLVGADAPERRRFAGAIGLDLAGIEAAVTLGLAIRLALSFSGGDAAVLAQSPLRLEENELVLAVGSMGRVMLGESVERRMRQLADQLGRSWRIGNADGGS